MAGMSINPDPSTGQIVFRTTDSQGDTFEMTLGPSATDGYFYIRIELPDGTVYERDVQLN